jgi:hypothetical protein
MKKWRPWTEAEDAQLREQLRSKSAFKQISIEGRSLRGIESRTHQLGLKLGTRNIRKLEVVIWPRRLKIGEIYCGE